MPRGHTSEQRPSSCDFSAVPRAEPGGAIRRHDGGVFSKHARPTSKDDGHDDGQLFGEPQRARARGWEWFPLIHDAAEGLAEHDRGDVPFPDQSPAVLA